MEQVAYIHVWKFKGSQNYHGECDVITNLKEAVSQYDQQHTPDNEYLYTIRMEHTQDNFGVYEQDNILYDVIDAKRATGADQSEILSLLDQAYYVDQALGIKRHGVAAE